MPFVPPSVMSGENISVYWVDAIADPKNPKLAELTSTTAAIDMTCYLMKKWGGPSATQEGTKDERYCTNFVLEKPGAVTFKMDALEYIIDPQNPSSVPSKVKAMLTKDKTGFIVMRWGKSVELPLAAGDRVDIYPVTLGQPVKKNNGADTAIVNQQGLFMAGSVIEDAVIVA